MQGGALVRTGCPHLERSRRRSPARSPPVGGEGGYGRVERPSRSPREGFESEQQLSLPRRQRACRYTAAGTGRLWVSGDEETPRFARRVAKSHWKFANQ